MKLRYWIAAGLAALIAIVAAGTAVLLETEAGLHWAIAFIEHRSGGTIEIGAAQGRLAGPLTLENLRVSSPTAVIEVHRLEGDWSPAALIRGRLHVSRLHGTGVRIVSHPSGKPFRGLPQQLKLPLHVTIDKARFEDLTLERGDYKLQINRLAFALDASDAQIRLDKLEARGPRMTLAGKLDVQPHGGWNVRAQLATILRLPDYPEIAGRTSLDGNLLGKLKLEQTLRAPFEADLDATATRLFDTPTVHGTLHLARLDPRAINASWPKLQGGADLDFDGGLHRFLAKGTVALTDAGATRTVDLDLAAGLEEKRLRIEHLHLALVTPASATSTTGTPRLSLHGMLDLNAPQHADLALAWKDLRWPLEAADPTVTAAAGGARLHGNLGGWGLEAETLLKPRDLPQGRWSLKASGTAKKITIAAIAGRWLSGTIAGNGDIGLADGRAFRFSARLRSLQLSAVSARIEGHADLDLAAEGGLAPLRARVRVSKLVGRLAGRRIRGKADLAYANSTVIVHTLKLSAGENRFDAAGRWGGNAHLGWRLQAPELAALGTGLKGRLDAQGSITGPVDAPRLKADLKGEKLRLRDFSIERLQARTDIDFAVRVASSLDLHAENIEGGKLQARLLEVTLSGPPEAQRFSLALEGDQGTVHLAANGRLTRGSWHGKLTEADLHPARGPRLALAAPAELSLGTQRMQLGKACWQDSGNARLCLAARMDPQGWEADAELHEIPLDLADPWLEDGLALQGRLDGTLSAAGGGGKLNVLAEVHAGNGSVTREFAGAKQRLAFKEAGFEARLDQNNANARLGLILADGGTLDATAAIPWRTHSEPTGRLHLIAHLPDLSGAGALSSAVSDVGGRLDADIGAQGSLEAPRFEGEIRLSHAAATLNRFGTRFKNGDFVLRGSGSGLRIEGTLEDEHGGRLAAKGTLERKARQWTLAARIQGKDFRALDTPEMRIAISPDLEVKVQGYAIALDGSVNVPSAQIKPPHFSDAIAPTPDLVIVGAKKEGTGPSWKLNARLHIGLGNDVSFAGYGLSGRIGGELTVNETPGRLTTATGELRILDGRYRAYGQDLEIQHGRLLFSGGPVANPGLDIRAARRIGMVTAGLQVGGTLRNPSLQVFSDPPMSQSNALAYLLFGHGVQQTSGSEQSTLNQAANAIGIAGGTYIAKSLGKHVGIDTVSVENASAYTTDSNQASLFLGKYLSPRLYVSYGIGLYEPINLLRVRYTLSRHWALQAESGTISGADILFNIEH